MNFKEQNKTRPRPWIKYYSSPSAADLEYPDGTMYDVFRDAALRNPDAPAIDYMTSRMTFQNALRLTYSTLRSTCPFSHPARALQKRKSNR